MSTTITTTIRAEHWNPYRGTRGLAIRPVTRMEAMGLARAGRTQAERNLWNGVASHLGKRSGLARAGIRGGYVVTFELGGK